MITVAQDRVAMKHGAGGRAMRRLIEQVFMRDAAPVARAMDDGAVIPIVGGGSIVVTTDSHVIHPIFFPGGDIGRLAISGTVNDLAMMGATEPLGLTCAIVLEEGFPLDSLIQVQASMTMPQVRPSGSVAPIIARSLTVPEMASRPMSPPGKNSGWTTCESVVITSH